VVHRLKLALRDVRAYSGREACDELQTETGIDDREIEALAAKLDQRITEIQTRGKSSPHHLPQAA
jgi:hypothetical protein